MWVCVWVCVSVLEKNELHFLSVRGVVVFHPLISMYFVLHLFPSSVAFIAPHTPSGCVCGQIDSICSNV